MRDVVRQRLKISMLSKKNLISKLVSQKITNDDNAREANTTMHGPVSNEADSNSNTHTTKSIDQRGRVRKVDCAIIGAGAAGLQCAANLLQGRNSLSSSPINKENNSIQSDSNDKILLVIFEARDRIGGRILTTHQNITTVDPEDPSEVSLCRDHGAAWVHGTHASNPMMQLLTEEISSKGQVEEATNDWQSGVLNPVFEGNPWVRPHTVLHRNGKKGENSLISFFMDGRRIPDSVDDDEANGNDVGNDPSAVPHLSRSSLSSRAIRRHYRLLREIVSKYNSDESESECDHHENVDHLYQQLNSTLKYFPTLTEDDEDEKELVSLLAPFYLYLMENWNGISMKDTEVDQVEDLLTPRHKSDNEEEKKDDKKHVAIHETDGQYVSAGDFMGPHCKVKTGMFTVLKPLLRILEGHQKRESCKTIFLGEEVVSIIDKKSYVRIETTSGKIFEANCCVSTIPLGCLQHSISIQSESRASSTIIARKSLFQPRLRRDKVDAINSIWSGSYKKVFLTFDHIFWPKEPPIIGLVRRNFIDDFPEGLSSSTFPGRYLLLYNLWARDRNIPSVEAILCGDLGKWAFHKSDEVIQHAVIDFIENAMGLSNLLDSCTSCHVTRWEEDEFTRGSYSAFQLGTLDKHVDVLGSTEWDGRLVFAGEATENDHMGSVHAALISGRRAAKQVLDFLPSSSSNSAASNVTK